MDENKMFETTKMIKNRFGDTASITTRLKNGMYKAELLFDLDPLGVEGLVRTGPYLSEQEAVNALNKKLSHIMG